MANTTTTIENVTEEPVKKKSTKAPAEDDRVATLEKQNAELQNQLQMLMQMMASMNGNKNNSNSSLLEEVKIVHLVDRAAGLTTHIELTNLTLDMSAFGEERTLDRRQAEELAGTYRRLFERGVIAFGAGNEEMANRFGLSTIKNYNYLNKDFVRKLGSLSAGELEELYNKLCEGHKKFVIEYFKRKILEKDPAFSNPYKIETLNRLSNGAMSDMILDRQRQQVTGEN